MIIVTNKNHKFYSFVCELINKNKAKMYEFFADITEKDYKKISDLKDKIPYGYYCKTKEKTCPFYKTNNLCKCSLLDTDQNENFCLVNKVKVCRINE